MSDAATETLSAGATVPVVTEGHVRIGEAGYGEALDPLSGIDPVSIKRKVKRKQFKTLGFGDGIYAQGVVYEKLCEVETKLDLLLESLTRPSVVAESAPTKQKAKS